MAVNVNLHAVQPLLLELVAYRAAADRGRTAVTEMPMELVVGLQEMLVIDDLEAERKVGGPHFDWVGRRQPRRRLRDSGAGESDDQVRETLIVAAGGASAQFGLQPPQIGLRFRSRCTRLVFRAGGELSTSGQVLLAQVPFFLLAVIRDRERLDAFSQGLQAFLKLLPLDAGKRLGEVVQEVGCQIELSPEERALNAHQIRPRWR